MSSDTMVVRPFDVAEFIETELASVLGRERFKDLLRSLHRKVVVDQTRRQHGARIECLNLNMLFLGAPGTGKTKMARSADLFLTHFRGTPTANAEGRTESECSIRKVSVGRVFRYVQIDTRPRSSPSACSEKSKKKRARTDRRRPAEAFRSAQDGPARRGLKKRPRRWLQGADRITREGEDEGGGGRCALHRRGVYPRAARDELGVR